MYNALKHRKDIGPDESLVKAFGEFYKIGRHGFLFRHDNEMDEWIKSDNEEAYKAIDILNKWTDTADKFHFNALSNIERGF